VPSLEESIAQLQKNAGERSQYRHFADLLRTSGVPSELIWLEPRTEHGDPDIALLYRPCPARLRNPPPSFFSTTIEGKTGDVLAQNWGKIVESKRRYERYPHVKYNAFYDSRSFIIIERPSGVTQHFEWEALKKSPCEAERVLERFKKLSWDPIRSYIEDTEAPHLSAIVDEPSFTRACTEAFELLREAVGGDESHAQLLLSFVLLFFVVSSRNLHPLKLSGLCQMVETHRKDPAIFLRLLTAQYEEAFPHFIHHQEESLVSGIVDYEKFFEGMSVLFPWDFSTVTGESIMRAYSHLPLSTKTERGGFTTPLSRARLAAEILQRRPNETFLDPTAGIGANIIAEINRVFEGYARTGRLSSVASASDVIKLLRPESIRVNDTSTLAMATLSTLLVINLIDILSKVPFEIDVKQTALRFVGLVQRTTLDALREPDPFDWMEALENNGVYSRPFLEPSDVVLYSPPNVRNKYSKQSSGNSNLNSTFGLRQSNWVKPDGRIGVEMITPSLVTLSCKPFRQKILPNLVCIINDEPSQFSRRLSHQASTSRNLVTYLCDGSQGRVLSKNAAKFFGVREPLVGEQMVITPRVAVPSVASSDCHVTFVRLKAERFNLYADDEYLAATSVLRKLPSLYQHASVCCGIEKAKRLDTQVPGSVPFYTGKELGFFAIARPRYFIDRRELSHVKTGYERGQALARRVLASDCEGVYIVRENGCFPVAHQHPPNALFAKNVVVSFMKNEIPLHMYLSLDVVLSYIITNHRGTPQESMRATFGSREVGEIPVPHSVTPEFIEAGSKFLSLNKQLQQRLQVHRLGGCSFEELQDDGLEIAIVDGCLITAPDNLRKIVHILYGDSELTWGMKVPSPDNWGAFDHSEEDLRSRCRVAHEQFNLVGERMLGFSQEHSDYLRKLWVVHPYYAAFADRLPCRDV